jgi:FtsP/CotA-like multicopper oxidase with cupredoxin domain
MANSAFIRIGPGERHTYTYTIPADHPTGLFWYHDPTHGASMLHVMGGLFGAIYVDLPVRVMLLG